MRIIRELFRPSEKCKRIGHDMTTKTFIIRRRTRAFRSVATDYKADIDVCKRCGHMDAQPKNEKEIDAYTSCTMPSVMWDEIRERGYVVIRKAAREE